MMTELQTPVDLAILLLSLLSKRSIIELFPEPGGPITMECASLLLILPLAIASSMAVINCCLYLSSPALYKVRVKMTTPLLLEMLQLNVELHHDISGVLTVFRMAIYGGHKCFMWGGGGGGGGGMVSPLPFLEVEDFCFPIGFSSLTHYEYGTIIISSLYLYYVDWLSHSKLKTDLRME